MAQVVERSGVFPWERRQLQRQVDATELRSTLESLAARVRPLRPRAVIGVPGDDVHVVANRLAERLLLAIGYHVTNLGVMARLEDFVRACEENHADAVLISSINGHATGNCRDLPAMLAAAGLAVPSYIGGNIAVGNKPWEAVRRRFLDMGFRAAFPPWTSLPQGIVPVTSEVLQRLSGDAPASTDLQGTAVGGGGHRARLHR